MSAEQVLRLTAALALLALPGSLVGQTPVEPVPDTVVGVPDTIQGVPDTLQVVADTIEGVPDTIQGVPPVAGQQRVAEPRILLGSPLPEGARTDRLPGYLEREQAAPAAREGAQGQHVVRRGDTLWDLAGHYLRDPFEWPRIFEVNRDVVEDPHWIFPNERLIIPGLLAADAAPADAVAVGVLAAGPLVRTRFHPSMQARAGFQFALEDVSFLPPVTPHEYYAAPWLQEPRTLQPVGEFLRALDPGTATAASASPKPVHPRDLIYLRYTGAYRPSVGEELLIVRQVGDRLGDYGRVTEPRALIEVVSLQQDVFTALVRLQFNRVAPGDLALPAGEAPTFTGEPAQEVEGGPRGLILTFLTEQPLYSVSDIGFVDLGRDAGVGVGDELVVYLPERTAETEEEETLPSEPIARMQVVRVTDRTATTLVTNVAAASLRAGLPVRVYKRIP
ncbi:MAG: LysM peptidoglycan-binding domain-containing protein [Longimicrobiales bacterium]